jgi:hypothetical protein
MVRRPVQVLAGASACAAALALSPTVSAQAASSPGWRVVFSHHYGGSTIGAGYIAVATPGRTAAWAVGGAGGNGNPATGRPVGARWHNGSWRPIALPSGLSGTLGAVSADSAKDAWAVSLFNGYVLHWNGTRWSVARRWPEHGLPRELTGVTALSPANVWVFGGPGAFPGLGTWHFNGHTWQHVTSRPGDGIETASALSATNMWAIGSASAPDDSIAHFTGRWKTVRATALSGLQFSAIAAVSSHDVWAAGTVQTNSSQPRLVHMTSRGWSRVHVPWRVFPISLAPDGRGGIWITAQGSSAQWALHRTGAGTWSRIRLGPTGALVRITLIPGTTSLWGAGSAQAKPVANAAVWAHGRIR